MARTCLPVRIQIVQLVFRRLLSTLRHRLKNRLCQVINEYNSWRELEWQRRGQSPDYHVHCFSSKGKNYDYFQYSGFECFPNFMYSHTGFLQFVVFVVPDSCRQGWALLPPWAPTQENPLVGQAFSCAPSNWFTSMESNTPSDFGPPAHSRFVKASDFF